MARPTSIRDFQAAQRGEMDASGDYIRDEEGNLPSFERDPLTGQIADSEPVEPKAEDRATTPTAAQMPIGTPGRAMQATHELIAEAERRPDFIDALAEAIADGRVAEISVAPSDGINDDAQPSIADHLRGLNVEASCTAEMSLHMITQRVREASLDLPTTYAPTENDVVAEAERIWVSLDRKRSHTYSVEQDGTIRDWRRPDPTPDRGPGVGTTVHHVTEDGPRFSGGGIPNASMELPGMPERESDDDESDSQARAEHLDPDAWGKVVDPERKSQILWPIKANGAFAEQMLLLATDLDDMVDYLIRTVPALQPLGMVSIRWYWRRKGSRANGQPVLITVKKADETLAHERDCDIVVKLAADHLRKLRASALFVEYLVCSVLARIDPDGPRISPSDVWAWLPVWWRYGLLGPEHRLFGAKFALVEVGDTDDLTGSPEPGPIWDDEDGGAADEGGTASAPGDDGAGTLIHDDGTPLTEDEIDEMEAAELGDLP